VSFGNPPRLLEFAQVRASRRTTRADKTQE
jgi:hypothetical protein